MRYNFYLNNISVFEPIGWDQVRFNMKRSEQYHNLLFEFTDELTFTGSGADYLNAAYNQYGIDAEVSIRIDVLDCDQLIFQYLGVVNFALYTRSEDSVKVGIRQSTFAETFKNRIDIPVNLSSSRNVDGGSLPALAQASIYLHSKEILFQGRYKINPQLASFNNSTFQFQPDHSLPWEIAGSELTGTQQPGYYFPVVDQPIFTTESTFESGKSTRDITVKTRVILDVQRIGVVNITATMALALGVLNTTNGVLQTFLIKQFSVPPAGVTSVDTGDFTRQISLGTNQKLIYVLEFGIGVGNVYQFDYLAGSYLELTEATIYPPSQAAGYLVHEVFSRITEAITGVADSFRSDYFGRTDSLPHSYLTTGEGANLFLTNGLNLRNMVDRQTPPQPFPVVASFNQLFDGLNAIHNLGMRIEQEGDKEYVRVEPKSYFYNPVPKQRFSFVSEIERSISLSDIYSEAEFGYAKWQTQEINGIDEFNTKRTYSLPIDKTKRKLSQISNFITGGYLIELTRREQFKTSPTKDFRTDNDLFAIAVIKRPDGSYEAERIAGFEPVDKLFSPFTAYNLRLSPARNAVRWRNVLAASVQAPGYAKTLRFTSGEANYELSSGGLTEDADIELTHAPLFIPEAVTFEVPLTLQEFVALKPDAIYSIEYSCNDFNHDKGFIRSIEFSPGTGMAKMSLIRT